LFPFFSGHVDFHVFGGNLYQTFLPRHVLKKKETKLYLTNFFIASLSRVYVYSSAPQSERKPPLRGAFLTIKATIKCCLQMNTSMLEEEKKEEEERKVT
jgi:hypothetical protein